jgi:hypothetical protein
MSFDVTEAHIIRQEYGWQNWYETFCICRHCKRATIFVLSESVNADYQHVHKTGLLKLTEALNRYADVMGFVSLKDAATRQPPEHLPEQIDLIFREGATCLSVGCYNAAGTMFRLCVDLASSSMLPEGEAEGLNARVKRNLGLRLPWLFDNGILPEALRELSTCIKDDGNDGAHQGTLSEKDVEDLLDFTYVLLERIYTEPERLRLAKERREKRRSGNTQS